MAARHWIKKAVKRPGAATRKAKAEGRSLGAWARRHRHDKNKVTRGEAQFALRARAGTLGGR